jgi:hypothetical protein
MTFFHGILEVENLEISLPKKISAPRYQLLFISTVMHAQKTFLKTG